MATELDRRTAQDFFEDGMPRVVTRYDIRDDIMYVIDRDGNEVPVWSDMRIKVNSRYDTHSFWFEWREKEYVGDPRPPQIKEYWDYHPSVEEALESALHQQETILREDGVQVPVILNER